MPKASSRQYTNPAVASKKIPPIELDPTADGSTIRKALIAEAAITAATGIYIFFFPENFLGVLVSEPANITPATVATVQHYGAVTTGLAVPLILGFPNTRQGIQSRSFTYTFFALIEVLIIATSLYLGLGKGDESGFSKTSSLVGVSNIGFLFLWRCYVLFRRPELFGRYRETSKQSR